MDEPSVTMGQRSSDHEANSRLIFNPIKFHTLEVKNRLFRSSISGTFDDYNGHGTNARLNWEEQFARGGIGAIISAFTPVAVGGRMRNILSISRT